MVVKEHPYKESLEILLSYPQLIPYEESLFRTPYDVTGWMFYLETIDTLLETMQSHLEIQNPKPISKQTPFSILSNEFSSSADNLIISISELPSHISQLQKARTMVGERALSLLPGSYKLWKFHLEFLVQHSSYTKSISGYERSLVRMNKMPRIWIMYLKYVRENDPKKDVTFLRRLNDRALLALPVTQHSYIWTLYKDWITSGLESPLPFFVQTDSSTTKPKTQTKNKNNPILKEYPHRKPWDHIPSDTILRVLRRYILYEPTEKEYLIQICLALQHYGEASKYMMDLLHLGNDFISPSGISQHDIWMTLAKICTHHPEETRHAGVDFDGIVRSVLQLQSPKSLSSSLQLESSQESLQSWGEMEGALWCKLADYHIRNGEFELARSVYEEGLEQIKTVRDFGMIFDAYANFEEGTIAAMMELMKDDDEDMDESNENTSTTEETNKAKDSREDGYDSDLDILLSRDTVSNSTNTNAAIELSLARAEYLLQRRPLLLNRVLLRQNPHNVGEWLRRAELYTQQKQSQLAMEALSEASTKVNARKAVNGNPAQIFITWAKLAEQDSSENALENARSIFRQVCQEQSFYFKDVDDLAQVYAAHVEMELDHDCFEEALSLIRQAISDPSPGTKGVARLLHKSSLRLWNLALDLEESLSQSISATRDAYERCLHLKIATPTIVLNYAAFLKQNQYFEESFAAYEKGLELFPPPHTSSIPLWKTYLNDFIERYENSKIIRTRELFERCVSAPHPSEVISPFYLLYANFEKQYASGPSLTKRLLHIYERQCTALPLSKKLQAYQLYIAKTNAILGPTASRSIYETAIQACNDVDASILCHEFAQLEVQLGEIVRARAAYTYGSQLVDPRRDMKGYWTNWSDFEIAHGDEESFREMLRVKRAVTAAFSTVNYNAAEMGAQMTDGGKEQVLKEEEAIEMLQRSEGVEPRVQQPNLNGFVSGTKRPLAETNVGLEEVEKRAERLRRKVGEQGVVNTAEDDEIDIDNEEEDDEGGEVETGVVENVNDVKTKSIPSQVFGGLADAAAEMSSKTKSEMGALERLRTAGATN